MGLIETEGIILKSYNLSEADKIVVVLTQEEGLVRGVAKGARRLKSKFGGSLEPFSIVKVTYFQKEERELVAIGNMELIRSFFEKASHPDFLQKFAYLSELLLEFSPPHDPNERLYRMAKICLETAAEIPGGLESIAVYFELWLLRLMGYLPNWQKCDSCRRDLGADESTLLQINFHLLCFNCQKARNNWSISPQQRQIFIRAQQISPVKFVDYSIKLKEDVKEVSGILKKIITNILGKEMVSEKVLLTNSR